MPDRDAPTRPALTLQTFRETHANATVSLTGPATRPALPAEVREWLGRYPVLDRLGAGAMGEVLEVIDTDVGREVAAKVLLDPTANARDVAGFMREAQVTGQLEHPNIIPLYELGVAGGGELYFTMKRVAGRTLEDVLEDGDRSRVQLLQIFAKVCDAVGYAHACGVVHRDLKPANIMVGAFGEVLVMDWGLARVLDRPGADAAIDLATQGPVARAVQDSTGGVAVTVDGEIAGTPAYMAPEQAEGRLELVDRRSDIHALGAILYELLTGRLPYDGATVSEVIAAVRRGALVPPATAAPERGVPWELDAVVCKAMAPRRGRRYGSVEALQADLEAYLEGRLLSAPRYGLVRRLRTWARRHRRGLAVAALVLAVAGVGGGATWRQWRRAEHAAGRATSADARARAAERDARMARLAAAIDAARPWFYVDRIDLQARLAPVREALIGLDRLTRDPAHTRDPRVWRQLGLGRMFVGDDRGAAAAFAQAVAGGAPAASVAGALGRIHLRRAMAARIAGQRVTFAGLRRGEGFEQARRWLAQAAAAGEAGEQQLLLALRGLAAGELEAAAGVARAELARAPDAIGAEELHLVLAWAAPAAEAALAACDQAVARCPQHLFARLIRATVRRELGRRGEREDLDRAIAIDPTNALAHQLRASARQRAGDLDGALADADRVLALAPGRAAALSNRAAIRVARGEHAKGRADYDRALALDPGHAVAWYNRGQLRYRMGDPTGAEADFAEAMRCGGGDADTLAALATMVARRKDPARARALYERALRIDPLHEVAVTGLAWLRARTGDPAGGVAALRALVARRPRSARGYHTLALIQRGTRDPRGALRAIDRAVELAPTHPTYVGDRAEIRQQLGDLPGALADMDAMIGRAPSARAHFTRGNIRAQAGDADGALVDFTRAIALAPGNADAYLNRGAVHHRAGRAGRALADYEAALRQAPTLWQAWFSRGSLLAKLGRRAEAAAHLRRAREHAPPSEHAEIDRRLARLATGG